MNPVTCPSAADLAKLLDGKTSDFEARRLRSHVADCESCAEVVSESLAFLEEEEEEAVIADAPEAWGRSGAVADRSAFEGQGQEVASSRRWVALAAGLLLVAGGAFVAFLVNQPANDLSGLAAAQGDYRSTVVRIAEMPHAPPRPVVRSGGDGESPSYALLAEAARLRALKEEDPSAANLYALGVADLQLGNYDQAVEHLEAAAGAAGERESVTHRARAALGAALLEGGLERDDGRAVARAHNLLAGLAVESGEPEVLFNVALALESLGAVDAAAEAWDRYLEVAPEDAWAEEAGRRRQELPTEPADAGEENAEALEDRVLLDLLGSASVEASANLDEAFSTAQRYEELFQDPWLADVVAAWEAVGGEERQRLAERHLSYAAVRRAKQEVAVEECLQRSRGVPTDFGAGSPLALSFALLRASCAYLAGDLESTFHLGRSVMARADAAGYPMLAGQGGWLAGLAAYSERRPSEALRIYEAARDHFLRTGDPQSLAAFRTRIADLYDFAGLRDEAWREAVAVLRFHRLRAERRHQALQSSADLAAEEGWPRTRLAFLWEATSLGPRVPSDHQADTWRDLALVRAELGDEESARRAFGHSSRLISEIPDSKNRMRSRAFWHADMAAFLAEREPARSLGHADSVAGFEAAAEGLAYDLAITRSRAARAQGNPGQAERGLARALESVQRELRRADGLANRAALHEAWGRLLRAHVEGLLDEGRIIDAWRAVVRSREGAVAPRGVLTRGGEPERHGTIFTFLSLDRELLVWRNEGHRLTLRRVPIHRLDLQRLIDRVGRWAQGRDQAGGVTAARRLSNSLFGQSVLRAGLITVLADSVTQAVPYPALPHPVAAGSLGEHGVVAIHARSPFPPHSAAGRTGQDCVLLIEGADHGGKSRPELGRLALVKNELRGVGARYPCQVWAKTETEVRAALAGGGIGTVHFAGHGIEGGLLFADGTNGVVVLGLEEISRWPLAGASVVLGACSTARSLPERSGLASLPIALLEAGASTVVANSWAVSDESANRTALSLHASRAAGVPLPMAVQALQREAAGRKEEASGWAGWSVYR